MTPRWPQDGSFPTPATHGLFGEREFRLMKPTAVFINVARGPVVQEPALIAALRERWIAGAGLDVFDEEPLRHVVDVAQGY